MKQFIIKIFVFFKDMLSDGSDVSSKRWIAATTAATLIWMLIYATMRASNAGERLSLIIATMSFILVILGVATMPQIIKLMRGGNDDTDKTTDK